EAFDALVDEIGAGDERLRSLVDGVRGLLRDPAGAERDARTIVESLAVAVQASLMRRHADGVAADAFAVRIASWGRSGAFGNVAAAVDATRILQRLAPPD